MFIKQFKRTLWTRVLQFCTVRRYSLALPGRVVRVQRRFRWGFEILNDLHKLMIRIFLTVSGLGCFFLRRYDSGELESYTRVQAGILTYGRTVRYSVFPCLSTTIMETVFARGSRLSIT